MAKPAAPVNRRDLENAIGVVEADGPLKNRSLLYAEVSKAMNDPKITPSVVLSRITDWHLTVKTPFGKKRARTLEASLEEDRTESTKEFTPRIITKHVLVVCTPGGKCPHDLKGFTRPEVHAWMKKVGDAMLEKESIRLTVDAYVYWLRMFIDCNNEKQKFAEVEAIIREAM